MKELLGFGVLAVGGYLLYEYFYRSTSTLTRGAINNTTGSGRIANIIDNGGMSQNVQPLTDTSRLILAQRGNLRQLQGLGSIAHGRGALLYGHNAVARNVANSGLDRPIPTFMNGAERLMRSN